MWLAALLIPPQRRQSVAWSFKQMRRHQQKNQNQAILRRQSPHTANLRSRYCLFSLPHLSQQPPRALRQLKFAAQSFSPVHMPINPQTPPRPPVDFIPCRCRIANQFQSYCAVSVLLTASLSVARSKLQCQQANDFADLNRFISNVGPLLIKHHRSPSLSTIHFLI